MKKFKKIALILSLIIFAFLWFAPTSWLGIEALTVIQQRMLAIFVFAAMMWIIEVIPNWTTSLLIIVMMLLTISNKGIAFLCKPEFGTLLDYKEIMSAFADPVIMLFLGGFVMAITATKYGIDATLANAMLRLFGKKPSMVLLGLLLTIGIFSMFMSNTATAIMMLSFMAPLLKTLPENETGKIALALAIPIAANIGGIGTPIGTPPNAIALAALANAGFHITFGAWMLRMVPLVLVILLFAWILLQIFFPFKSKSIELKIEQKNIKKDWKMYLVWITFFATILLWITENFTGINANIVALIPLAIFTCTGIFTREDLKTINWSVLWLVSGGFALGIGFYKTGLADIMVEIIPFGSMNVILLMLFSGFICYLLSNFISNSSTAALMIPILIIIGGDLAATDAGNHEQFMAIGGTMALVPFVTTCISFAMLFPISTPPCAIAASTGLVRKKHMIKCGLLIAIVGFTISYFLLTKILPFNT